MYDFLSQTGTGVSAPTRYFDRKGTRNGLARPVRRPFKRGETHSFTVTADSAPHAREAKESACGCAGIFNAPHALECYAQVFEEERALDRLEGFASEAERLENLDVSAEVDGHSDYHGNVELR